MYRVRHSFMGETARAKSFLSARIKHLHMLSFDGTMERIAGAVPVCMLHLTWTCVVDQHYIRSVPSGDKSLQAMTTSIQDDRSIRHRPITICRSHLQQPVVSSCWSQLGFGSTVA